MLTVLRFRGYLALSLTGLTTLSGVTGMRVRIDEEEAVAISTWAIGIQRFK
jgi:hypothetical protein